MSPARQFFAPFACVALLVCCGAASAAPVPPGTAQVAGQRSPTPGELADARKAYEAIGGRYYKDLGLDSVIRHNFALPRDTPATAYAKLPDLSFEYALDIDLGENITPGALGHLARLKGLRSLRLRCCLRVRDRPVHFAASVAELATVPNLERLSLEAVREDPLADELAAKLPEFKSLRAVTFWDGLTDAGLKDVAKHPALESVSLILCEGVTDAGLGHLSKLKTLRDLSLQCCDKPTAAGLRLFASDPRLIGLTIVGGEMNEEAMVEVGKIRTLERLGLNLPSARLTERELRRVGRLSRLRELALPPMKHTDAGLEALSEATNLESLDLSGCSDVTDAGIKSLTRLARLRSLRLSGLDKVTNTGLKELAKLSRLETLGIHGAKQVNDDGIKALLRIETLSGLDLSGTGATEAGVRVFVADRGRRLRWLGLHGMSISDESVARIAFEAPNLTRLYLYRCRGVTDKSLPALAGLSQLRYLSVAHTSISKEGVEKLKGWLPNCSGF